ncbi:MAG: hypothetical protein M3Y07_04375, partial [Acidobacteriota bacterium]|nr:hypothetical protein [Acidobacteriota bacterium]
WEYRRTRFHRTGFASRRCCTTIIQKKQTTAEIAQALKKGGVGSSAKNFDKTVRSGLERWRSSKGVIKVGDSWALPTFYSPAVRASLLSGSRLPKVAADKKKRSTKQRASKPVSSAAKPTTPEKSPPTPETASQGSRAKIASFLLEHGGAAYTIQQLATVFQITEKVAQLNLAHLVAKRRAEKTADGKYRSPKTAMPLSS